MFIQVLPPAVAERIAAGEVIERPSSVVKELVENSLDAGATEIEVHLEDGGKSLIEVTDNGDGMSPEDLALSVQRHATSKLKTLDDLERIMTLGFRGEALPSVAAVSDLSMISRAKGTGTPHELKVSPFSGKQTPPEPVTFGHFLNSPHGTRIQARGLFSQIPARLKFLKSQAAEVSQVREWVERLALAHPSVGFRMASDGRNLLSLRPSDEGSRAREILADGEDYPLVSFKSDDYSELGSVLKLRLHWLQGLSSPQTRKLVQVVNGRAVRDRLLQQALLAPFRQALMPGQFPALVLFVEVEPSLLDLNVHPTKTEIRFLESRKAFQEIQNLVDRMIHQTGAPAYVASAPTPAPPLTPVVGDFSGDFSPAWPAQTPTFRFEEPWLPSTSPAVTASSVAPSANPVRGARFAGTLFNTYLLYDLGQELALVDQHAAHERIRFEALKKRIFQADRAPHSQALLIPEAVRFPAEDRSKMEERLPLLHKMGFDAELFSDETVLFRGLPAEWGMNELKPRLKNLIDRLSSVDNPSPDRPLLLDEHLFETLASEACHSSVRAGDPLEKTEAQTLVDQLFECEHPWNCPHGRPTLVKVPRSRLEEWFSRRL